MHATNVYRASLLGILCDILSLVSFYISLWALATKLFVITDPLGLIFSWLEPFYVVWILLCGLCLLNAVVFFSIKGWFLIKTNAFWQHWQNHIGEIICACMCFCVTIELFLKKMVSWLNLYKLVMFLLFVVTFYIRNFYLIYKLQWLCASPVFTYANQSGLDMLETTLVSLQDKWQWLCGKIDQVFPWVYFFFCSYLVL